MSRLIKILAFACRYFASFFWDIYYELVVSAKVRVQEGSYYLASKSYPGFLKSGAASEIVKNYALLFCKGKGIDLGAGGFPLNGARPVDLVLGEGAENIKEATQSLDYVFSSHMLEHVDDVACVVREVYRVLKTKGVLFLYLPHPASKMWDPKNFKYHKRSLEPASIKLELEKVGFNIQEMSYFPDVYFSYFIIAEKN